jgi:hypothetical protein
MAAGAPVKDSATDLDSWNRLDWEGGVQLDELNALDGLTVTTRNSTYEFVVMSPEKADVLVRGGSRFPSFTPAQLRGCSIGGSILKRGGVYPGFRLEIEADGQRILTSTVRSVDLTPPGDEH